MDEKTFAKKGNINSNWYSYIFIFPIGKGKEKIEAYHYGKLFKTFMEKQKKIAMPTNEISINYDEETGYLRISFTLFAENHSSSVVENAIRQFIKERAR